MSEHQEIRRRLAVIGKNRKWLATQLKMSEHTIRQYLQPKGKRTKEFMAEIERVTVLEEIRQKELQPDAPPWNVLFNTAEEFDRVDRASREIKSESLIEFCRGVLLKRADEILEAKRKSPDPKVVTPTAKVADKPKKENE